MTFLKSIRSEPDLVDPSKFPFSIPFLSTGLNLEFTSNVTFFVGENGSGKSTLLEAIADGCGFNHSGGNRNLTYSSSDGESNLTAALRFSWMPKVTNGFFMRAESFYNFATYIDQMAEEDSSILQGYGGKSLHQQSHGESFLSLFVNRFNRGIYILDEPEAALSPNRQLSFMALIHQLETSGKAQFIIATHSPILLSYPDSVIFSLDAEEISQVTVQQTEHYRVTRDFLDKPDRFFRHLFAE
ncbi:MAG: AAA family ATPase [Chloroflexi bacterium HGW-Chloroflexi-4]|jgi:predicted ATPase|nr:MAG: AAA family ATPase [Chloroflexi bacterium HGW-Chloroflexi-4]